MEELATQEKMVLFALVPWDLRVQLVRVSVYIALVLYWTLRQINSAHCFGRENLPNTAFFYMTLSFKCIEISIQETLNFNLTFVCYL